MLPQTPSEEPRLVTIARAARQLAYSTRHINILIQRGELQAIGSGRGRRVVAASIATFIERQLEERAR